MACFASSSWRWASEAESLMAMAGGILAALVAGRNDPGFVHNGPLAGLVAVCAGSDVMHPLGALVTGVDEGGPAEKAALRPCDEVVIVGGSEVPFGGDIIVGLDGVPITGSNLSDEILRHKPGDRVVVDVLRGNRKVKIELILGSR